MRSVSSIFKATFSSQIRAPKGLAESFDEEKFRKNMPDLAYALAKMAGRRITATERREIFESITNLFKHAKTWPKYEFDKLSPSERKRASIDLTGRVIKELMPGEKFDNPLEYMILTLYEPFREKLANSYLAATKFAQYRTALFAIVDAIFAAQKQNLIDSISSEITDDEVYAFFQTRARLSEKMAYLERKFTTVNKKVLAKYIELHGEIASFFELLALQFLGIKKILDGETVTYKKLKLSKLADIVRALKTKETFAVLVASMNVTVRNAIKHGGDYALANPNTNFTHSELPARPFLPRFSKGRGLFLVG